MDKVYYSEKKLKPILDSSLESQIASIDAVISEAGYNRVCTNTIDGQVVALCEKNDKLFLIAVKDGQIFSEDALQSVCESNEEFFSVVAEEYFKNPDAVTKALSAELD